MKYRKTTIMEDNGQDIRSIKNKTKLARKVGVDRAYISRILNGKEIASEKAYLKIKANISYQNRPLRRKEER